MEGKGTEFSVSRKKAGRQEGREQEGDGGREDEKEGGWMDGLWETRHCNYLAVGHQLPLLPLRSAVELTALPQACFLALAVY